MAAGHVAPERGAASARIEASTHALVRAPGEESKSGGGTPAGVGVPIASAHEAAVTGTTGGADARGSGPASGVSTAQPGTVSVVQATPGPMKVLHIQLHPAELGMLQVSMQLTDAGLEVHIEAARQETLALLKSDRETLASVLRGAGHAAEAVTVSLAEKSGLSGHPSQDGWQPPASDARPEAESGSPREQAREQGGRYDDRSPSRAESGFVFEQVSDEKDQSVAAVRPPGGLYL